MNEKLKFIFELSIVILIFLLVAVKCHAGVDTSKAVIHHTASHDVSAKEIDRWHKERGWDGIGYHYVIRQNGNIEEGRPLNKVGAHAKGRNNYVGIALTGYNDFTNKQRESLRVLLISLKTRHIERHHESCPGNGLDIEAIQKWLDKL